MGESTRYRDRDNGKLITMYLVDKLKSVRFIAINLLQTPVYNVKLCILIAYPIPHSYYNKKDIA